MSTVLPLYPEKTVQVHSCPDSESLNWQLKEKLAEYQKQIDYLKNIGKVGSAVKYTSCNHLLEQCGLGRKRFEQIDLQYLQDFEAFLIRKGHLSIQLLCGRYKFQGHIHQIQRDKERETDNAHH